MARLDPTHFLIVGAGAAGLMTARELVRPGNRVTIVEGRDRCGGRILPLPTQEFGYPAEGGAEFVHGAAPVTRTLMREARLSLLPRAGTRWSTRTGALLSDEFLPPHADRFYQALSTVKADLPISWRCILPRRNTNDCGGQSRGRSRAMTRPTRAVPARSHSATSGWP